jgi:DNA-binding CsgD family transcriptional regulator/pimeloyl-ACP methyl ester carboxylesterase
LAPEPSADGTQEAERVLRSSVHEGQPSLVILDEWRTIQDFADVSEAVLIEILQSAASPANAASSSASVSPEGIGFALVDGAGRRRAADQRFSAWVGDPADSPACRNLARSARKDGRAVGLVRTPDHGVLSVLASAGTIASKWPGVERLLAETVGVEHIVLAAFAPSRSQAMVLRAATALGLTDLEARVAAALLSAPSLEMAARSVGVGRETAKDAIEGALRKTGARSSSQLLGRIIDLSCGGEGQPTGSWTAMGAALGLSPSESHVAELVADGVTAEQAGRALGLTPQTIKSYRRSIFAKLGVNRSRELRRLMAESTELNRLDQAGQVVWDTDLRGRLRATTDPQGRRIAVMDYGPASGRPLLLFHGYTTGRVAPPPLLRVLGARGYRVIIPQRPGFGLTAPALGDYLTTAVSDTLLILDRLHCERAAVIARDGGVAAAIALAEARPERIGEGLLLNPRSPGHAVRTRSSPVAAISAMLFNHPRLIEAFSEMMLRQTRRDVLAGVFRRVFASVDADRCCFDDVETANLLMDDLLGLVGRATAGFIAEHRMFSDGWQLAAGYRGPRWPLAFSGALSPDPPIDLWRLIALTPPAPIEEGGLLVQFTHPHAIADLLAPLS